MSPVTHMVDVGDEDAGARVDKFLAARLPDLSRSRLQALMEAGYITCDNRAVTEPSAKVKRGQRYDIIIPEAKPSHLVPQAIALDVVYEDEHLLVINKPPGLTVHPGAGNPDLTLANALLAHCGDSLSGIGGVARPGIVHRIDKDTSGLLVVAKHDKAHLVLSEQLAKRTLKRTYQALVWGAPKSSKGTITGNIGRSFSNRKKMAVVKTGGKPATTYYKVIQTFPAKSALFSLLECQLETGRTHQIRVHLAHIGQPLVGDPVYGQKTSQRLKANAYKLLPEKTRDALLAFGRQALHARELELIHPKTSESMRFTSDLPPDMQALLALLS